MRKLFSISCVCWWSSRNIFFIFSLKDIDRLRTEWVRNNFLKSPRNNGMFANNLKGQTNFILNSHLILIRKHSDKMRFCYSPNFIFVFITILGGSSTKNFWTIQAFSLVLNSENFFRIIRHFDSIILQDYLSSTVWNCHNQDLKWSHKVLSPTAITRRSSQFNPNLVIWHEVKSFGKSFPSFLFHFNSFILLVNVTRSSYQAPYNLQQSSNPIPQKKGARKQRKPSENMVNYI